MSIIGIILLFAVIGFVLWAVTTYVPMPAPVQKIMIAVVVILLIVWLLTGSGLLSGVSNVRLR